MKRNVLNFLIDAITAVVMLGMIATGLLLRFVLPPGSGSRRALWGWGRHDWGDLHFWLAAGVAGIIVLHVALHWQWVCSTALRCIPRRAKTAPPRPLARNMIGASLILLLVGVFASFVWFARDATADVRAGEVRAGREGIRDADADEGHRRRDDGAQIIRGATTLAEAARVCGITVEEVRQRLRVPTAVRADEQLGRLASRHGFSMQEARERLSEADGRGQ